MQMAAAGGFLAVLEGTSAMAAETPVHVSLWDKGPDSNMIDGTMMLGMGKMMSGGDTAMAIMGITADVTTIAAGTMTFEVVNASKDIIHEVIFSPIASRDVDMPYLKSESRVHEESDVHLDEVSELDPGQSGALTVDLEPRLYLLYCNIPGHYIDGLWTVLTVTE
jgi:uncharacterized cupredoxin-like copper-binding protein